jgi:hypothetical protein
LLFIGIRFKERFAGSFLTWQDVQFFFLRFGDNIGVMATQPTLLAYCAAVLACLGGFGWFCWRLDRDTLRAASPAAQALSALLALLVAGWSVTLLRDEISVLKRHDAWLLGSLGDYGRPLAGFLATTGRTPQWTSVTDTTALANVCGADAASTGATAPADIVPSCRKASSTRPASRGCPMTQPARCSAPSMQTRSNSGRGPRLCGGTC